MKNLATPLGLTGFGSHSEADRSRNQFFDWRVVGIALFVFAGYFLGAKIGFALTFRPHPVSVVRKSEGTRRPVNLNEIVREVLRLLHSDLLGRGTAVETQLAPNLPSVDANPVQLQQVLLNLLTNSLEAMQSTAAAKRRVVISTTCEANSSVTVSVRDYGGGLPKDDFAKIFTRFYSTKPTGMGMGLTIVRSIVESHGGELAAENADEGARFSFRLPVAAKNETGEVA